MEPSNPYPNYGVVPGASPPPRPRRSHWLIVVPVLGGLLIAGVVMVSVLATGAAKAWKSFGGSESDDTQLPIIRESGEWKAGRFTRVIVADEKELWGYGLDGIGTQSGVWLQGRPSAPSGWSPVGDYASETGLLLDQVPESSAKDGPLKGYLSAIREGADDVVFVPARGTLVWVNRYSGRVLTCTQKSYSISTRPDGPSERKVDPYGQLVPLAKLVRSPLCVAVHGKGDMIAVGCSDFPEYPDQEWSMQVNQPNQATLLLFAWNESGVELRHELRGPKGSIRAVAFSTDGAKLYSGGNDHKIHVWNTVDGTLDRVIEAEAPVVSVSVDPQRPRLLYCTERGHIVLLDLSSGERKELHERIVDPPRGNSRSILDVRAKFSPNGTRIALLRDRRLEIIDAITFERHGSRTFEEYLSADICWSPEGRRIGVAFLGKCYLLGTEIR